MAFKSILFVSLLVAAVVIPLAQSQIIPALLSVIRIDGILYCTVNGNVGPGGPNATPVFANATVQLQCDSGNNVVSTVTTTGSGVLSILLDSINYLLSSLLSTCRLVVTTPLASCNVNLSPTGILTSALQFVGNTVVNVAPVGFVLHIN
ncbi:LOW QUALITY PROTEIN: phylloplanin-like [Pyrus x bretschneideri]|uniref:LOW QUALITY PROTEIN: phylloplanin-like n=1 Tax=Pyrus x bretschneideri TaxID=225117 RepID=UPI00202F9CEE|nr:LOW QUALITY PROTEIN: phylloplanin-like [Pyrus x bretschneideri]